MRFWQYQTWETDCFLSFIQFLYFVNIKIICMHTCWAYILKMILCLKEFVFIWKYDSLPTNFFFNLNWTNIVIYNPLCNVINILTTPFSIFKKACHLQRPIWLKLWFKKKKLKFSQLFTSLLLFDVASFVINTMNICN